MLVPQFGYKVPGGVRKLVLPAVGLLVPDREPRPAQVRNDALLLVVAGVKQPQHAPRVPLAREPPPVQPHLPGALLAYKRRTQPPQVEVGLGFLFLNCRVDPINYLLFGPRWQCYHVPTPFG